MRRASAVASALGLSILCAGSGVRAEEIAPYSGGFFSRSTLTGDWGGARNDLAAKGITFDLSWTQVGQGVLEGGKDRTWEYGGRGNLTARLDTQKAGLWPGGFLTVELEGNYGEHINGKTGALMAANGNQLYPEPGGEHFNVPQWSFAQFLSPYAGVIAGKLDTLSGDANDFAHGKGDVQFMNLALSLDPVLVMLAPYSTLGAGVIVLPTKDPAAAILNFLVLQANGDATTSGFENLHADEMSFVAEGRMRTGFFGLTGHQLLGGGYSNKEVVELDQRIGFAIDNRGLEAEDGTWAVYYNFDQYLYEREPGRHGLGVFGRFGASDGDANPLHYFYSIGVGATGMLVARPYDRFGIGYYYLDVESPTIAGPLRTRSFLQDEWGFEAFYNVAITPWLLLTPDVQVIGPAQKRRVIDLTSREDVDTAVILGFRVQVVF
jgi:porin